MKYIVSIDIGGTTFNSGIFTDSLNQVAVSKKDKIRFYKSKNDVVNAIVSQVNDLIDSVNISKSDILGLGVGAPGPLDPKKGIVLDTPNLKIFNNYNITYDLTKKLRIDTFIENDANLFALGEWLLSYKKNDVVLGITLGTGLGFGLVINGQIFTGGNGMAMEYGLSPFKWGLAEENVSIRFLREKSKSMYKEIIFSKNIFYSILALNNIIENDLEENNEEVLKFFEVVEKINITQEQRNLVKLKKALYLKKISRDTEGNKLLEEIIADNSIWKETALEISK